MWGFIVTCGIFLVLVCQLRLLNKRKPKSTPYNALLPNVTVFAMGGTIAGCANSSLEIVNYIPGSVGIEKLIEAVPAIKAIANINGVQVTNMGSENLTPADVLKLAKLILAEVAKPNVHGIVITHGTDSLEETAMFLDLTISTAKPIVVVGAMRPSTAIGADGPMNLLNAVAVASSNQSMGRGTLVLLNDRIGSAFYTTKTNGNTLDTFKSYEAGSLGIVLNQKPFYFFSPAIPTGKVFFDIHNIKQLPRVDILYGYQGLNPKLAESAVHLGAKGLVLAAMGATSWTDDGNEVISSLIREHNIPVVYSHRTAEGYSSNSCLGIPSYFLNPQKARYMLMLAISSGYSIKDIEGLFSIK